MSDVVMRYNQCDRYLSEGGGEMEQDEQGDWVLYSDLEAQLAQRDAALKAADELAGRIEKKRTELQSNHDYSRGWNDAIFSVQDGARAYRKARGQDAD